MLRLHHLLVCCCVFGLSITLIACGKPSIKNKYARDGAPKQMPYNLDKIPNAVPKIEPKSRCGNRFKKNTTSTYVEKNRRYTVLPTSRGYRARGQASWYGTKFHGRKTSSGETYNMYAMTAAHRTLPLPTYAKITNLHNGKSVIVKVNDRGPFHKNRIIDLSYAAAHKLGMLPRGVSNVEIVSIDPRDHRGRVPLRKPLAQVARTNSEASSKHKFYLQFSGLYQKPKAVELAQKLKQISDCAIQLTETNQKPTRFNVRLGPFQEKQALELTQKFARAKLPSPVVITE